MVLLQRKLYFSKDTEGVQHFSGEGGGGGSNFFQGEMHTTQVVIFQKGVQTPYPPFWIRTWPC